MRPWVEIAGENRAGRLGRRSARCSRNLRPDDFNGRGGGNRRLGRKAIDRRLAHERVDARLPVEGQQLAGGERCGQGIAIGGHGLQQCLLCARN